jgi:hypothetical protein
MNWTRLSARAGCREGGEGTYFRGGIGSIGRTGLRVWNDMVGGVVVYIGKQDEGKMRG